MLSTNDLESNETPKRLKKGWEKKAVTRVTAAATLLVLAMALLTILPRLRNYCELLVEIERKEETINGIPPMRKRPNLIFIMTDQQKYDALSIAGNEILHTPNMDRIAREGAYFTSAYSQCPVCGPARTSLMTGRTIENTRVLGNNMTGVICNAKIYDEYLVTEEDYVAEYYGKWHAPANLKQKYSNVNDISQNKVVFPYRAYLASVNLTKPSIGQMKRGTQIQSFDQLPYRTNPLDNRHGMPPGSKVSKTSNKKVGEPDQHGVSEIPEEHTLTAYEANQFLKALERLATESNDQPFSLHLSFNLPHSPITPSEPYASMFNVKDMIPPPSIGDPMSNSPYNNSNNRPLLPEYSDPDLIKYMISGYYACIKEIDVWLGRILNKIDELGLASNTLLVFTSDHGEMLGAHGMREKNVFYEESVHVPLMIRFPGVIIPGTVVEDSVSHIDLFPTILDYLGAKPQPSDGKSLRTQIERQARTELKELNHRADEGAYVVSEWNTPEQVPNLMIRTRRWKLLIPNLAESKVMNVLYDLKNDPYEMNNLLGNNPNRRFYLKEAEKLKALLMEFLIKVDSPHLKEVMKRKF